MIKRIFVSTVVVCTLLGTATPTLGKFKKPKTVKTDLNIIRGVIRPSVEAVISSEIQARIIQIPFKDGQRFKKNDILVKFDCSKLRAELEATIAEYTARQKTLENALELSKLNAIGQLDVDIAKADSQKALAAAKISKVNVKGCQIKAPFSGRVVDTVVNQYESVNPYDKLLTILDDSRFEIELILPSKSLQWLKQGAKFTFTIDETAQTYPATLTQIGASIDPVSQTIRGMGVFKSKPKSVLSGMSGSATFRDKPVTTTKKPEKKQPRRLLKRSALRKKAKLTTKDLTTKVPMIFKNERTKKEE